MDTLISQIEEKILYLVDFNQKTLEALTSSLSQNHELKAQLEGLQLEKLALEEKLGELLKTLEQSQESLQESRETHKDLHEIL